MKIFKSPPIHRTPYYRAVAAWQNMNRRCLNKDGKNRSYSDVELRMTREEFVDWALPFYESMLEQDPTATPSVSRKGDAGHYEIGNIEIIPWKKHRAIEGEARRSILRPNLGRKFCTRCREEKEYDHFAISTRTVDGHAYWCKECFRRNREPLKDRINKLLRERRRRNKLSARKSTR